MLISGYSVRKIMYNSRVPRYFAEGNYPSTRTLEDDMYDRYLLETGNAISLKQERPLLEEDRRPYLHGIDNLASSINKLDNFPDRMAQPSHDVSDMRNYLSSTYLNPNLNPWKARHPQFHRMRNTPRI